MYNDDIEKVEKKEEDGEDEEVKIRLPIAPNLNAHSVKYQFSSKGSFTRTKKFKQRIISIQSRLTLITRRPTKEQEKNCAENLSELDFAGELLYFLKQTSPFNWQEWPKYSPLQKIYEILQSIPHLIMKVCIPEVDVEKEGTENWCRLLTCVNVLLAPQALLFLLQSEC